MRASRRLLLLVGVVGVIAVTAAAAFAAAVSWGKAVAAGGAVSSISCARAGNCAAGGSDSNGAFVQDETGGVWGAAIDVPDTPGGSVNSVSCASAGDCAAGGYYTDNSAPDGERAFLVDEQNGVWGTAIDVPGAAASAVRSISCAGAGQCAAVGWIASGDIYSEPQTFVVKEKNGVWGQAALSLDGVDLYAVSCVGAGSCVAGGVSGDKAAFVRETNGVWGAKAVTVAAPSLGGPARVTSISCVVTVRSCAAGGPGFVMLETHGVWRKPVRTYWYVDSGFEGFVSSISCGSPGNCVAGGYHHHGEHEGVDTGWLMTSKNGQWGPPRQVTGVVSGNSFVNSVSCAGAGRCVAVGNYGVSGYRAFVVAEKNGVWGKATNVRGAASLGPHGYSAGMSVSCVKSGRCALGGLLEDTTGFVTAP